MKMLTEKELECLDVIYNKVVNLIDNHKKRTGFDYDIGDNNLNDEFPIKHLINIAMDLDYIKESFVHKEFN